MKVMVLWTGYMLPNGSDPGHIYSTLLIREDPGNYELIRHHNYLNNGDKPGSGHFAMNYTINVPPGETRTIKLNHAAASGNDCDIRGRCSFIQLAV